MSSSLIYSRLRQLLGEVDVTTLEPRSVVKGSKKRERFIAYWTSHLPDVSERPEIPPEKTRFWKMGGNKKHGKKHGTTRFPKEHSKLSGLRGKSCNDSIDYAIAANKWCVTFKDEDGCTNINLVDECIVCVWLNYISEMVRVMNTISTTRLRQLVLTSTLFCLRLRFLCLHVYVNLF